MPTTVTPQDVQKAAQAVRKAETQYKGVQKRFDEAVKDLSGALKDKNEEMVLLYRPRLTKVDAEIADTLQDVEFAIGLVKGLQEDPAFLEKQFTTVEKLLESVTKMRTVLAKHSVTAKMWTDAAGQALTDMQGDDEDLAVAFARVEDVANKMEARLDKNRASIEKHLANADIAIRSRDQSGLETARRALLDMKLYEIDIEAVKANAALTKLAKKHPKHFLIEREADGLARRLEELSKETKTIGEQARKLVEVKIEEAPRGLEVLDIDFTKAAKLLGVAPKDAPRLTKVLMGKRSAYEKALARLAEELGLAECDGKKIVAILVKGKVIER